ncbi:hypothetical protein BFP72_08595 [Reichenbachiella sp. 5M10]|uniref:GAF domain-containing protein n=1 Tax=Reichenbachiella sp. 5M10 TaxID=1889772 RepID=UPI000C148D33|nr:GAF domain-containing protein [Reichenbachiella sp. 5M10]PIB35448.1 hypothetical protein BFP72_08595 [Reichenbachiella sp. 5M10]
MSKIGFYNTDYKIQSKRIYRAVLFGNLAVAAALLVTEWFVDLKVAPLWLYLTYFVVSLGVTLESFTNYESKLSRFLLPLIILGMIEYAFFVQPDSFKTMVFWLPFIPTVALITQGLRASQLWALFVVFVYMINSYYVKITLGENYTLIVFRQPTFIAGIIFMVALLACLYLLYGLLGSAYQQSMDRNAELTALKNNAERKQSILHEYNAAMINLTRNDQAQELSQLIENIGRIISVVLNVNRISIWMFNEDRSKLTKQYLLDDGVVSTEPTTLTQQDYPRYFEALETKPFIMAPIASTHPDTMEFQQDYLTPFDIRSMLDCPILKDNVRMGVICCENKKYVRNWSTEEALTVQSMADYIASHFKNEKIKDLMDQLQLQNNELLEQGEEIAHMNQELHALNQKLIENNGSLESTVAERTKELQNQNKQLKEYAFVNSHMLRAPISNILGLVNLLENKQSNTDNKDITIALSQSAKNLDKIARKISSTLEDGSTLTRKDIDYLINKQFHSKENK